MKCLLLKLQSSKAQFNMESFKTEKMNASQAGNISETTHVSDEFKLLDIFPEEVWLAIFEKVENSDDLMQVFHSSLFFRNLLLPFRTRFLFPKVWQIIGKIYETSHDHVYKEHKTASNLASKQDKTKWFSGILKCRLVCKCWCEGVDNFYRNFEDIYRMKHDAKLETERDVWGYGAQNGKYYFSYSNDLRKFQGHFDHTHGNGKRSPFLANTVSLKFDDNGELYLSDFLETYGKHVWHCNLGGFQSSSPYLFRNSIELFGLMPNLKSLRIWNEGCTSSTLFYLEQEISANPFPTLYNLKFLEVDNLLDPVSKTILENNRHVSMLELSRQNVGSIFSHEMPNLSQLSIQVCSREHFDQLRNSTINWKLEKVYLNFCDCFIEWSEIFRLLEEKWSGTAVNVAIHLPKARTAAEMGQHLSEHPSLQLSLPNVKRLKLVLENASSIDFVLPMQNTLTQLEIIETVELDRDIDFWKKKASNEMENQVIQFHGFQQDLYTSNIWNLLPVLQILLYDHTSKQILRKIYYRTQ